MKEFWKTNSLVSNAIENQYILLESHMIMPEVEKILTFHLKRAKPTLSLIMIMVHVHKSKIIYNDHFLFKHIFN
jgi:hypothetical protein